MSNSTPPAIKHRDLWIEHQHGKLFARVWEPRCHEVPASPILLFHDSLGCVELWREFPEQLCAATGRRVIAYDRLGFGRSAPRHCLPGLDFIAEEASGFFPAIAEQVGFKNFIACGHSVGGGMAVNCAAEFADDCEALITESAQVFPEARTLQGIEAAKEAFKDQAQMARLARYHGTRAQWVLDAWTEVWLDPAFASWTLEPVLPRVTCPVLAIHGLEDEYGSARHPEMIAQLTKGASRCELIADAGHVPHRECGELILGMITGFVATLETAARNRG